MPCLKSERLIAKVWLGLKHRKSDLANKLSKLTVFHSLCYHTSHSLFSGELTLQAVI